MPAYKISIPRPCAEPWANMQPTGCGAFCHSCQKEVIDFTNKSYPEIAKILNKRTGPICGKFTKEQTEFEFEYATGSINGSWFRKGVVGAFLSMLVAVFTSQAQTPVTKQKTESVAKKSSVKLLFSGTVIDDLTKKPIENVMVTLVNNPAYLATTDSLGRFELKIDKAHYTDSIFRFSKMSCVAFTAKLEPGKEAEVFLKPEIIKLDEVVVSGEPYGKNWNTPVVGELPYYPYQYIYVTYKPIPVDMMMRHYFGISIWD